MELVPSIPNRQDAHVRSHVGVLLGVVCGLIMVRGRRRPRRLQAVCSRARKHNVQATG